MRGELGRYPEQRRQAQELGLPILVIKSDSLHQVRRSLERLLERRGPTGTGLEPNPTVTGGPIGLDDAHAGLEECRLAVERVVLPEGRPVELQPRSERVRQLQAVAVGGDTTAGTSDRKALHQARLGRRVTVVSGTVGPWRTVARAMASAAGVACGLR